ncbi:MAG: YlbF family regulator [Acholeplasmataceae bacterium]|nr:YlbF family regulator [Acholeplasmataceae bacterium]
MTEKTKLLQMMKEHPKIQRYQRIEKAIHENEGLKAKLKQLKDLQKQLINAKELQKPKAIALFTDQYNALLESIEEFPLMSEYLALQSEINETIQSIAEILEKGVNTKLYED